jgi:hypothetical protein
MKDHKGPLRTMKDNEGPPRTMTLHDKVHYIQGLSRVIKDGKIPLKTIMMTNNCVQPKITNKDQNGEV